MDEMQNQMNAILNNPEMMQKIMALAQSMNQQTPSTEQDTPQQASPEFSLPNIDLSTIQRLSGLANQSNIDNNQRSLLKALTPYISRERISKLERAMRAAKLANIASGFLGRNGGLFQTGR